MNDSAEIAIRIHGHLAVVTAPAEIDLANATDLLSALRAAAAGASIVILDMAATTFCDSTGFLPIVKTADQLRARGGDLRVVCCSPRLYKIMTYNKDHDHVSYFASMIEALNTTAQSAHSLGHAA
jgi:anti-anti-sigma factor